jgi:hypothetical protein
MARRSKRPAITPEVAKIHQLVSRVFGRVEVVQIIRRPAAQAVSVGQPVTKGARARDCLVRKQPARSAETPA